MNIVRRDDVLVGFRPESLLPKGVVQPDDDAVTVPFHVHRVENLGSERHLVGTVSGIGPETRVIAMLPSTVSVDVAVDETSEFVIRGADLRFFDTDAGLRTERRRL
jgi:multiple sugar transport system ATP-binding protein